MTNIERLVDRLRDRVRDTVYEESSGTKGAYDAALDREEDAAGEILAAFRDALNPPEEAPQGVGWCSVTDLKVGDTYTSFPGSTLFEYTVLEVGEPKESVGGKVITHVRAIRDSRASMVLGYFDDEWVYRTSCAS